MSFISSLVLQKPHISLGLHDSPPPFSQVVSYIDKDSLDGFVVLFNPICKNLNILPLLPDAAKDSEFSLWSLYIDA